MDFVDDDASTLVWSHILEYIVKAYVTRPSSNSTSMNFCARGVLTHDKIE
jgi:hypothetical protein